jgi:hypothetical protein
MLTTYEEDSHPSSADIPCSPFGKGRKEEAKQLLLSPLFLPSFLPPLAHSSTLAPHKSQAWKPQNGQKFPFERFILFL